MSPGSVSIECLKTRSEYPYLVLVFLFYSLWSSEPLASVLLQETLGLASGKCVGKTYLCPSVTVLMHQCTVVYNILVCLLKIFGDSYLYFLIFFPLVQTLSSIISYESFVFYLFDISFSFTFYFVSVFLGFNLF